jgi:hypothetical protein
VAHPDLTWKDHFRFARAAAGCSRYQWRGRRVSRRLRAVASPPGSIRQLFNRTSRFLVFVAVKTGTCDLAHANQPLLDAYRNHLTSDPQRRPIQVANLLRRPSISGRLT